MMIVSTFKYLNKTMYVKILIFHSKIFNSFFSDRLQSKIFKIYFFRRSGFPMISLSISQPLFSLY